MERQTPRHRSIRELFNIWGLSSQLFQIFKYPKPQKPVKFSGCRRDIINPFTSERFGMKNMIFPAFQVRIIHTIGESKEDVDLLSVQHSHTGEITWKKDWEYLL